MRENPMCRTCVHLDLIDADPDMPCPECGCFGVESDNVASTPKAQASRAESMTVMAHPECKTCGGYGEMEPWSDNDEVPCTNHHCVMGCDTSKPKEPVSNKIAKAVEMARGYDTPPEFSVVFNTHSKEAD